MQLTMHGGLSNRAQAVAKAAEQMGLLDILKNIWDPATNPEGIVSLGVAENTLMHQELTEFINSSFKLEPHHLTYGPGAAGSDRLRRAAAAFLTRHFRPVQALEPDHVFVTAGCTTAIEHLGFLLGDGGDDALLLARPYYHAFKPDLRTRTGTKIVEVAFGDADPFGADCVARYEAALRATRGLVNVRGLILCSPHNPLGRCYPRETLIEVMKFCQKHQIHLISDEIYGLSVWNNDEAPDAPPFVSVLSIDPMGIIDRSLLHVLWGMSKDFGANGLRTGYIISQHNKELRSALKLYTLYSYPSSASDHIAANILEDFDFTDKYIATNNERLAETYCFATNFLKEKGVPYYKGANAGFFLWVDLKKISRNKPASVEKTAELFNALEVLKDGIDHDKGKGIETTKEIMVNSDPKQGKETTKEIMANLLEQKVFLADSDEFGGEEEGWFRIVFSQDRRYVEEGLRRMMMAVSSE